MPIDVTFFFLSFFLLFIRLFFCFVLFRIQLLIGRLHRLYVFMCVCDAKRFKTIAWRSVYNSRLGLLFSVLLFHLAREIEAFDDVISTYSRDSDRVFVVWHKKEEEEEDKLRLDHDDISSTMTSVYFVLFLLLLLGLGLQFCVAWADADDTRATFHMPLQRWMCDDVMKMVMMLFEAGNMWGKRVKSHDLEWLCQNTHGSLMARWCGLYIRTFRQAEYRSMMHFFHEISLYTTLREHIE